MCLPLRQPFPSFTDMSERVDITLSVDPDTARRLADPAIRARVESELEAFTRKIGVDLLMEAIAAAKHEARANGLTDEMVEAELAAWKAERREVRVPPAA